jgi:hypothetical protein
MGIKVMLDGYNIFNVIWDFLKGDLKKASNELAATRQSICNNCEMRNETFNICTICGCVISAKVKLKKSSCPMELW